jgi:hypothetical protein
MEGFVCAIEELKECCVLGECDCLLFIGLVEIKLCIYLYVLGCFGN